MSGLTEWRDTTSYSRDDKKRIPTTYTIKHGWLTICITCGHIHHKPNWVLHCAALGIDTKRMYNVDVSDNVETVQHQAIEIIEKRINETRNDIINIKKALIK